MIYILVGGPRSGKTRFLENVGITIVGSAYEAKVELDHSCEYGLNLAFDDYDHGVDQEKDGFVNDILCHHDIEVHRNWWFPSSGFNLFLCMNKEPDEATLLGSAAKDGKKAKIIRF